MSNLHSLGGGYFAIYFKGSTFKGPNDTRWHCREERETNGIELRHREAFGERALPGHVSVFLSSLQTFFSDQSDRGVIDEVRMKFEKADQIYGIATEFSRDEESVGC